MYLYDNNYRYLYDNTYRYLYDNTYRYLMTIPMGTFMTIPMGTFMTIPMGTFMTISHSRLLIMGNVPDKNIRQNQNTRFMLKNVLPQIVPFMRWRGKIL